MLVVIALGADGAKLLLELFGAHDLGHGITSRYIQCLARNLHLGYSKLSPLCTSQVGKNSKLPAGAFDTSRTYFDIPNVGMPDEWCMMRS
jgi:hypothetical protein